MKTYLFLFFLTLVSFVNAQEIDARLRLNNPEKIESIFNKNKNHYFGLLFELDESWSIKTKEELSEDQIQKSISHSTFIKDQKKLNSTEIVKGTFNWISWGIVLSKDTETTIALENNTFLCFPSKINLYYAFEKSSYYRKK